MRGDPYVLNELAESLVCDWYDGRIYTEHDMQSSAYFHLRQYFNRERNHSWILRNQPTITLGPNRPTIKPDFGVFRNTKLYDVYELKCLLGVDLDAAAEGRIDADLAKIKSASRDIDIRHAYFILVCDDCNGYRFDRRSNDWSHGLLSVVVANVYCHLDSGRKRRGYDAARSRYDNWKHKHSRTSCQ